MGRGSLGPRQLSVNEERMDKWLTRLVLFRLPPQNLSAMTTSMSLFVLEEFRQFWENNPDDVNVTLLTRSTCVEFVWAGREGRK